MAASRAERAKSEPLAQRIQRYLAEHPDAVLTCLDTARFGVAQQTLRNVVTALVQQGVLRSDNTCRPAQYRLVAAAPVDPRVLRKRVFDWLETQGNHEWTAASCARRCDADEGVVHGLVRDWLAARGLDLGVLGVLRVRDRGRYRIVKALPKQDGVSDNGVSLQAVWHAVATPQEDSSCVTTATSPSPPPSA